MNTFTQSLTIDWINTIGWTLLHSLWQAAIVAVLVAMLMRLIAASRSGLRYAIAAGGLLLTTIISFATLFHLVRTSTSADAISAAPMAYNAFYFTAATDEQSDLPTFVIAVLQENMPLIVGLWAIGFVVFALRWVMGLYHSYRLRSGARLVEGEWQEYVHRTALALRIPRSVKLAESVAITAPMVLGYLKPLILIPAGMIAGLSTQQLETIFLHELAHIRRNDYLINFFQTIVESIFFFNPFVRMLSNAVRREREFCCDDIVVNMHGNSSAYAHALVRLAEVRLDAPAFALSLTGDKNQLLTRIKRIMERSAKNSSLKSRVLIPVLLLAGALASISWIGANREDKNHHEALSKVDTVPSRDDRGKSARFSRKSIITIDENGQPHEEVIQEFEGDEELRSLLENNMSLFNDSAFANGFHGFGPDQFDGGMMPLWHDTIPPFHQKDWQEFADAFDERFESFFEGQTDPRKLMEEFEKNFHWEQWATPFENFPLDSLRKRGHDDVFRNFREEFEKFRGFAPDELENFRRGFKSFDNPIQQYEHALREQLIEDGYLSPDERIESLQWSDDSFKVNGKSLKPADVKKYNDLREGILEGDETDKVQ